MSGRCHALLQSSLWVAWAVLLIAALAIGCGSDSSDSYDTVAGPLPTGADDPPAYTEDFLAHNPRAQLQPEHLAIVRLDPTGGDDDDTCGEHDGVDCLTYFIAEETLLRVSDDGTAEQLGRLVLRAADGTAILTHDAGSEPASILLAPGEYTLELHHLFAGVADAPEQTIFLQPSTPDDGAAEAGLAALSLDVEGPAETPPPAPPVRQLVASSNCLRCNFAHSQLANGNFDDKDLTGSNFKGAKFSKTSLRHATLVGCTLLDLVAGTRNNCHTHGDMVVCDKDFDRYDADFSRAIAPGVRFTFDVDQDTASSFFGIFRDAELDGTVWAASHGGDCLPNGCSVLRPDFRNASLRGAEFDDVILTSPGECYEEARADEKTACTFEGADLTAAIFSEGRFDDSNDLALCRFGKESHSQRATTLRGADLRNAWLRGADFSGLDLSGAKLQGVDFSDLRSRAGDVYCHPQPFGARLAGANLAGASIGGAKFRGVNLAGAVIQGIVPATFNGLDLTKTNFSGVNFTGIDLSQTDLSKAILFGGDGTVQFDKAELSDGMHGVNLSGQRFPLRWQQFKGVDLTYAILFKTELVEANLEGVILNEAQLVGANLNFANLHGAKLHGAHLGVEPGVELAAAVLHGAFMTDVDLTDADLRSVDLTAAHLYGDISQTLLVRVRLDSADLSDSICSGAHFSGTLNNAVFEHAQLVNAVFNGATLTGAKFGSAYLQGTDFSNAISATGAVLTNAAVAPTAGTWSFMERDGTPFIFRYEATELGPLATDASVVCPNASRGPCCASGDLVACASDKLKPKNDGPYPPVPDCVPKAPKYDNCITPVPTATPRPHA